jgi:cell division transport system permease protein
VKEILQPWFSNGDIFDFVPLPTMVHVLLLEGGRVDLERLRGAIEKIDPDVELNDRSLWQRQLLILFRGIQSLCVIVVLSMMGAMGVIVFLLARASMVNHLDVVDIMQVVGAHDDLVIRVFRRRALRLGLYGTLLGMGLCFFLVFGVLIFLGDDIDTVIRGDVMPSLWQWLTVPMVGVVILLMVSYVTGRAIRSFLRDKEK